MNKIIHWKSFAVFLMIVAGVSFAVSKWFDVSYWIAFIIIAVALLIVGWIASIEDEMPGGFNNPKNK